MVVVVFQHNERELIKTLAILFKVVKWSRNNFGSIVQPCYSDFRVISVVVVAVVPCI